MTDTQALVQGVVIELEDHETVLSVAHEMDTLFVYAQKPVGYVDE